MRIPIENTKWRVVTSGDIVIIEDINWRDVGDVVVTRIPIDNEVTGEEVKIACPIWKR